MGRRRENEWTVKMTAKTDRETSLHFVIDAFTICLVSSSLSKFFCSLCYIGHSVSNQPEFMKFYTRPSQNFPQKLQHALECAISIHAKFHLSVLYICWDNEILTGVISTHSCHGVSHSISQRFQTQISQPFVGQMCSYFVLFNCCILYHNIILFLSSIVFCLK